MAQIKYKARYRKKGVNPFAPRSSAIDFITVDIDEKVPIERVKEMAKEAAPGGYEFIEVERVSV